jgi:hypothetical protein
LPLSAFGRDNLDKPGKRAVVGLLHFRWENTGGKFVELKVVGNAVAAFTFSGARLIGAGTFSFIGFNLAFHLIPLLNGSLSSQYPPAQKGFTLLNFLTPPPVLRGVKEVLPSVGWEGGKINHN